MKHIWCIDDDRFTLNEGYVMDDYRDYEDDFVWTSEESTRKVIGRYKVENIFDNKETAINVFNGMVLIQIRKLESHINNCKTKIDELTDKLVILIN